jgi:hypothetical protein
MRLYGKFSFVHKNSRFAGLPIRQKAISLFYSLAKVETFLRAVRFSLRVQMDATPGWLHRALSMANVAPHGPFSPFLDVT